MNFSKIIFAFFVAGFVSSYSMEPIESPAPHKDKLPLVFHPSYDIGFFGLEKVHPFDSRKYGKVAAYLKKVLNLTDANFHTPEYPTDEELRLVMTDTYLNSLYSSSNIAKITEISRIGYIPNFLVRWCLLTPMGYATGGTIKATELTLDPSNEYKYAINLGGGYHHATGNQGGGFCIYPDIPLACKKVWEKNPNLKILYVDLDAHQGNGTELTLEPEIDEGKFIVFDMYGGNNYPRDSESSRIRRKIKYDFPALVKFPGHTISAQKYLENLYSNLPNAIHETQPDLIFYNAGTDVYKEDPLGGMLLSEEDIQARDEFVFQQAKNYGIPIVMTLSGGYSPKSARIIGESIKNIIHIMDPKIPLTDERLLTCIK